MEATKQGAIRPSLNGERLLKPGLEIYFNRPHVKIRFDAIIL